MVSFLGWLYESSMNLLKSARFLGDLSFLCRTFSSVQGQQVLMVFFLSMVILWGQIGTEVLYSADGIVYALVAKELVGRSWSEWVILTWNHLPFFEHPHLTPWILAFFMKIFGVSTLSALLPIVCISHATVLLTYFLGRKLLDHRFGILASSVLSLTPQFVKKGRAPMLEPALMLCIMLVIFFYLHAVEKRKLLPVLCSGFFFGCALLAKGPPALLALAVLATFQSCSYLMASQALERFQLSWRNFFIYFLLIIGIGVGILCLVDLWYHLMTGRSFFHYYISHQLELTILRQRGALKNHLGYYVEVLLRYWPWLPFVVLSTPLIVWKKDHKAIPAWLIGSCVMWGTYLGFTLLKHKSEWFVAICYVGASMLVALSLRYLISSRVLQTYYVRFCFAWSLALLFLASSFPSLFSRYDRPFERFVETASYQREAPWKGSWIADCISMDPWKGPFFLKFYWDATATNCKDPLASFKIIDVRKEFWDAGNYQILFSLHPFSIIKRRLPAAIHSEAATIFRERDKPF